jgi:GNAT superfamily N-acetyltransferase
VIRIRALEDGDREWLAARLDAWDMRRLVSRGRLTEDAAILPGFVALHDGWRIGYALVRRDGNELEVVAIECEPRRRGAGKALLDAARDEARRRGCHRAWLITTNDNVNAIAFYLRCGWRLVAVHHDALEQSRTLKPEIPQVGEYGLPLRDELEFELPTRTG